GATVVVNDNILRIMPTTKLAQQPDLSVAAGEESEICYYPLKNMTAKDILIQVKSFLSPNAVCVELTRPNAVLLCDVRTNIPKIKQLLDIIDTNGKNNWPRAVVKCNNILPSQVTEELRTVLPVLGFYVLQSSDKAEQPGSIQLSAIDRLQVIVASAATEEAIKEIRQWVNVLDSSDSLDQERVFVYKVMHGKADQLMQALAVIYNTQGTTLTIDSNTGNDRTTNVNSNNNSNRTTTNNNRNNPTGNINQVSTTQTDVNSNVFDNQVRIFADGVLNRLVIRTTPRTYASIKALLDRLDVVPAQVLLQVLVVEVTLSESTKFGIEMAASGSANGNLISGGTNYSNLNPYPAEGTTGDSGGKFLISDPDDPESKFLYINALAGDNMIKVISSPQMLVSSHTQAYISVGSEVPYVKSNMTDTSSTSSSGTSIIQDIEYKTTGVTLTVTPQITSNNLISLEIKQELSSVETNTTSKLDSPVFPSRTLETTMTIANGKTMVLGGLIQEKKNDNLNSVPFINKIPYLGRLLGSTESSVERSEILVLVTGHIVNEKSEVEDLIKRYNTALKSLNAFDNELGDNPNAPDRVGDFERRSKGEK
ncbi:MAG: secretin N-terminal domain-containing protein, partial [Victivallaceae bacterium]